MRENKYFEEFGKPFDASDVSWRLQYVDKTKIEGFAVPYLDARAIADRLDTVVGQGRWKDSYTPWHNCTVEGKQKQSQLCTIYIYDDDLKEWIGKTDGAEDTDVEPIKGGLSDAFKRAAVRWNIGRYLYGFEPVWVKAKQRGNGYVIDKSEEPMLEQAYNSTVAAMFGTGEFSPQSKQKAQAPPQKQPVPPEPAKQSQTVTIPIYEIARIKVEKGANGEKSAMVLSGEGGQYTAYMNGSDNRLKTGTKITNIQKEVRKNSYGQYAILKSYDIAA